jgi:hypothetical protein
MSELRATTKEELLADIGRTWDALNAALERLSEPQMTSLPDAQGWTVKDHIIHLTSWERSVVFFLQSRPRHVGLGVDQDLYLNGSEDKINAAIFQQGKNLPLLVALEQWRDVHQQLLTLLQPLSDAELRAPYRHYLPDEQGIGDGPPAFNVIYSNSAQHFAEHQDWMEALVGNAP